MRFTVFFFFLSSTFHWRKKQFIYSPVSCIYYQFDSANVRQIRIRIPSFLKLILSYDLVINCTSVYLNRTRKRKTKIIKEFQISFFPICDQLTMPNPSKYTKRYTEPVFYTFSIGNILADRTKISYTANVYVVHETKRNLINYSFLKKSPLE